MFYLRIDYVKMNERGKKERLARFTEVVRAVNHVINVGWAMYWGTARWTPYEIMEAYTNCRQFNCITPIVEQAEYHMFCREKAELYMPETYSKIGKCRQPATPINCTPVYSAPSASGLG